MLAEGVAPSSIEQAPPGRIPGAGAVADGRADADPAAKIRESRRPSGRRRHLGRAPPTRSSTAWSTSSAGRAGSGAGLLRLRRVRQARRPVARPAPSPSAPRRRVPFEDMKERMLFAEALESIRCLEEGVLHVGRRRQHRLHPRHRLPGLDRRRAQYVNRYEGGLPGFVGGPGTRRALRRPLRPARIAGREGREGRDAARRVAPRLVVWFRAKGTLGRIERPRVPFARSRGRRSRTDEGFPSSL